jgi:hypothetical protein
LIPGICLYGLSRGIHKLDSYPLKKMPVIKVSGIILMSEYSYFILIVCKSPKDNFIFNIKRYHFKHFTIGNSTIVIIFDQWNNFSRVKS